MSFMIKMVLAVIIIYDMQSLCSTEKIKLLISSPRKEVVCHSMPF